VSPRPELESETSFDVSQGGHNIFRLGNKSYIKCLSVLFIFLVVSVKFVVEKAYIT
jgi:hypothetical protein